MILELLPNGVVMYFGNPDGAPWRRTYSYFSLIPYGYANFGPFLTAILTCFIFLLCLVRLFRSGSRTALRILSALAVFTSLLPLLTGGIAVLTVIGLGITILLVLLFCSTFRQALV